MDTELAELPVMSLMIRLAKIILRFLAVIVIGFVSAVIGLILGAVFGGILAAIYELVSDYPFVFNGRESYEATGQIGFILGGLVGLVGSSVFLFRRRAAK